MEDAGQLAYLRASVRECGFDKKMRANPARCGTLDRSGEVKHDSMCSVIIIHYQGLMP